MFVVFLNGRRKEKKRKAEEKKELHMRKLFFYVFTQEIFFFFSSFFQISSFHRKNCSNKTQKINKQERFDFVSFEIKRYLSYDANNSS